MSTDSLTRLTPSAVPITNLYYLVCYAFDAPECALHVTVGEEQATRPLDLIALLLLNEVERLLKRGLTRDYIEERAELAGVRGRVDFTQTTQRLLHRTGCTACVFTSYVPETAANQALATTLERLTREASLAAPLRARARRLRSRIPAAAAFLWRPGAFDGVVVPRQARSYQFALHLCRTLVNDALPHADGGESTFTRFGGDGRWLGGVFERFALRFWQREAPFLRTKGQRNRAWRLFTGSVASTVYLPELRTDIELVTSAGRVIVDTKCYRTPLTHRFGTPKLRADHVNQLFAYLCNARALGDRVAGGMLLYAQVDAPIHVDLEWDGEPVRVRSVDLGSGWEVTRRQMLAVAAEVAGAADEDWDTNA